MGTEQTEPQPSMGRVAHTGRQSLVTLDRWDPCFPMYISAGVSRRCRMLQWAEAVGLGVQGTVCDALGPS